MMCFDVCGSHDWIKYVLEKICRMNININGNKNLMYLIKNTNAHENKNQNIAGNTKMHLGTILVELIL
jgi:hypothetical protein